jgi:hypothetical protein
MLHLAFNWWWFNLIFNSKSKLQVSNTNWKFDSPMKHDPMYVANYVCCPLNWLFHKFLNKRFIQCCSTLFNVVHCWISQTNQWTSWIVATLTWPSVGVKPNTWKSGGFGVLRDSRMFRARQQDPKHLALGCSWCHWKGLEA